MAIKKAKFPASILPAINAQTEGYLLRYRIVSEDRNRISAWSPVLKLEPNYVYQVGTIKKSEANSILTLSWDPVGIDIDGEVVRYVNNYDIWVAWEQGPYQFYGSTAEAYANLNMPESAVTSSVRIYHKTNPPTEIEKFKLYDIA